MMSRTKILLAVGVAAAIVVSVLVQAEGIRSDGVVTEHFQPEDALYKSPVHMAMNRDGSRLFVVCEKADSVQIIDSKTRQVLAEVPVGHLPYSIVVSPDDTRAYVSNRWDDTVSVIDTASFEAVQEIVTGGDPHGLMLDREGKTLYVANYYHNDVSLISTETFETVKRLKTAQQPVELTISPDGRYIYVSNLMTRPVPFRDPPISEVTIIDTGMQIVVDRRMMPGVNISQGIAASPDGEFVCVAVKIPKNLIPETQIYQGWMVTYAIAVLEAKPGGRVAYLLLDEMNLYFADPFGLAFSPDSSKLFVGSSGVDVVSVIDMGKLRRLLEVEDGKIGLSDETIKLYARHLGISFEYIVDRIDTGFNPKGLTTDPSGTSVYVANRLADSISVIDIKSHEVVDTIDLGGPKTTTQVRRGEYLFNHAIISFQRQMACNTCHPENNVDGLLYDIAVDGGLGGNLVDNRSMRGVAYTGPFKWSGKNPTLHRQEGPRAAQLFFRSHGFTGNDQKAVVAFIETIPVYPNRHIPEQGGLTPAQQRGKELFARTQTNEGSYIPIGNRCITCHPAPFHTGRQMNDVGTKAYFDTDGEFDTPQLNGVYMSPPYLHDGRCWSLEEIWTLFNPYDLHGVANDMTKQQLNDLIEYLKTL